MPTIARVTCPNCGTRFQVPVEQILDPRVDPTVTERLLSGAVNIAQCPRCGYLAPLDLPLLYHDPEKEVALLYIPLSAGKTEAERQQAAGKLTRQLMDRLPPEERKGYLFKPETFVSMQSLIKRVYELEGIDEATLAKREAQSRLLEAMLTAEPERWETILNEQGEVVDEEFFALLLSLKSRFQALKEAGVQLEASEEEKLDRLIAFFLERDARFRAMMKAKEAIDDFIRHPSYEKMVDAFLAQTSDKDIEALAAVTYDKLDYNFFNEFVRRIEAAETEEEKEALREARRRVLAARDKLQEEERKIMERRLQLLQKLLETEEPRKMVLSHLGEIDDPFFSTLLQAIAVAEEEGNTPLADRLRKILELVMEIIEQNMPPQIRLARKLAATRDEATIETLLRQNASLVDAELVDLLQGIANSAKELGNETEVEQLNRLIAKVTAWIAAHGGSIEKPQGGGAASGGEDVSRGFIISTKK